MTSHAEDSVGVTEMFNLIRHHEYVKFLKYLNTYSHIDLNYRDSQENHLITYAIRFNKSEIVKELLARGARYDVVDRAGRSILYDAIESNYIDIIKIVLDHAQFAIGIMIVDIKDTNNNIPLHYAIKFNNVNAIQLLIDAGSKLYTSDNKGYNSLHMAIKTKDLHIVKSIASTATQLDAKTLRGETALLIAINYQYNDIASYLLDIGANPDIADDETDLTPIHYAVGWNNADILANLIKHNANVESQDIYGNTPLFYCIKENHDKCFDMIIEQKPNLNIWNIDGKLLLHEVLDNYNDEHSKKYVDSLIGDTNVSHQDSYGNTCLHYLVSMNLWKDYIDILKTKRLNIFAQNSESEMVIDFVKKEDMDLFIGITVESYLNALRREEPEMWTDEINKLCSRNLTQLTPDQKEAIKKKYPGTKSLKKKSPGTEIDKISESDGLCSSIIENRIRHTITDIQKGNVMRYQKSYPHNVEDIINVHEGILLDITTFTGSLLDVLIGLLYILKTHPNACSILKMNNSTNQAICDFYRSMGLIMSGRCEFINFEIVWIEYKLYMIDDFADMFKESVKLSARFIIIPLGIELRTGSHANYLIYDKHIKELERFEPHGGITPIGFNYNSKLLDDIIEQYITSIDSEIKYIRPEEFIPKIGFQMMDAQEARTKRIGDPGGFCALWSIWYVDQRITYSHHSRDVLIRELFLNIREKGISYRNLIRNYSRNIIRERDRLLNQVDLDINDWLNERYSNNTLDKLMLILNNEIIGIIKKSKY